MKIKTEELTEKEIHIIRNLTEKQFKDFRRGMLKIGRPLKYKTDEEKKEAKKKAQIKFQGKRKLLKK